MNKNEIGWAISFFILVIAITIGGLASEKYIVLSGICAGAALIALFFFFYFLHRNSPYDLWGNRKKVKNKTRV